MAIITFLFGERTFEMVYEQQLLLMLQQRFQRSSLAGSKQERREQGADSLSIIPYPNEKASLGVY